MNVMCTHRALDILRDAYNITEAEENDVLGKLRLSRTDISEFQEQGRRATALIKQCVVCLDKLADNVVLDCGHICLCKGCARDLGSYRNQNCPCCRAPIRRITMAF